MWLKVGTLASGVEEKIDGYVWQANTRAVKAAWLSVDPESGVIGYRVAVGTTAGIFLCIYVLILKSGIVGYPDHCAIY